MVGLLMSWMIVIALGWLAWPLTAVVFPHAETRGYAYARPLALILLAWGHWLLNVAGLLDNSIRAVRGVALGWTILGLLGWTAMRRPLVAVLKRRWRSIVAGELLAISILALVAVYKAHTPGILHTEQPMDFAFLNGCWVSDRLPPQDPWLSGHTISYYYLGYLVIAMIGRLTGLTPGVAYNVGLAITAAMTAHIGYALIRDTLHNENHADGWHRWSAVLGAIGLTLAGNAEWLVEILHSRGWLSPTVRNWLAIPGLAEAPSAGSVLPESRWWWWRASRVIYDANMLGRPPTVITEFPAFSLILGDLHPHLMSLPYLLLAMAMGVALYRAARETWEWRTLRTVTMPLILGALGMLNSWDLPTMLVFCGLAYAAGSWQRRGWSRQWLSELAIVALWLGLGAIVPYLPFYSQLQSQASGVGLAYYAKTPLRHYVIVTSPWIPIVVGYGIELLIQRRVTERRGLSTRRLLAVWLAIGTAPWLCTLLLGGWGRILLGLGVAIGTGPWLLFVQSAILAALMIELHRLLVNDGDLAEVVACLCLICSVGLTYVTEFAYVQDMFGSRMNTMFKVYYQAWALLAIGATLTLARWWRMANKPRTAAGLATLWIVASLAYPAMAAYSKSEEFSEITWNLGSTAHLAKTRPDEAALIDWIIDNTEAKDVILMADGEEFVPWTSRIAAWTGRPTVLGWPGHEAQWRGSDALVIERRRDIETAYTTPYLAERDAILQEYDVSYVIVGPNEMDSFGRAALQNIGNGLNIAWSSDSIRIYSVPQ